MILGIGTDICSIDRISGVLERHRARFAGRCFTSEEQDYVEKAAKGDFTKLACGYAKRWAAKESCAKALGLGIRDGISMQDISVINDGQGRPSLLLRGGAKERLTAITPEGMTAKVDLSLSDEYPMALAFVVISAIRGDLQK